jgi:hypothetical protein
VLPECALCGELNPSALIKRASGFVCANCEARERGRPEAHCARCGLTAPFERHHVEGRRNSPTTAPLCLNCHRIAHAADMRRTLRGAGASIEGTGEAAGGQRPTGRGGRDPLLDMGAGEVAGGQRATVRGGDGPMLDMGAGGAAGGLGVMIRGGDGPMPDMGAGEVAGGQRATVRGRHGPTFDMGDGEAAGGQGAMVRGGHGPMLDRSHRAGRRGTRVVAARDKRP